MPWEREGVPGAVSRPTRDALRRPRRALLLLGLLLVLIAGCARSQPVETKDDYQVTFATDPAPPVQDMGTAIVVIKDKAGQGVDGARVSIEANMAHAGMKPEYADATIGANGEYRMPLDWSMGGSWYVEAKITLKNGDVVRRRFPVDVQ